MVNSEKGPMKGPSEQKPYRNPTGTQNRRSVLVGRRDPLSLEVFLFLEWGLRSSAQRRGGRGWTLGIGKSFLTIRTPTLGEQRPWERQTVKRDSPQQAEDLTHLGSYKNCHPHGGTPFGDGLLLLGGVSPKHHQGGSVSTTSLNFDLDQGPDTTGWAKYPLFELTRRRALEGQEKKYF